MSKILPSNFQYPEIKQEDFRFGSSQLSGVPLREDGDWRDYLPLNEYQNRQGVESSSCYVFAQQNAIATILEEQFGIVDSNFSERYNALLSDGTPQGGDPLKAGQSFRHDGLIPDSLLPFSPDITSWEAFHSFNFNGKNNENVCKIAGKDFLKKWQLNYDIVFTRNETPTDKYIKLREALKYSPVPVSVYGWVEEGGVYKKPNGVRDNHLALCVYLDEQSRMHIRDSYDPMIKICEPWYNSEFACRWSVSQSIIYGKRPSLWQRIYNYLIGK